jgi:hypothetical protein
LFGCNKAFPGLWVLLSLTGCGLTSLARPDKAPADTAVLEEAEDDVDGEDSSGPRDTDGWDSGWGDTPTDTPIDTPSDTPTTGPSDTPVEPPADTPVDPPAPVDTGCAPVVSYADADGDAHGDPASAASSCSVAPGRVTLGDDCDDDNPRRTPGRSEVCDGLDSDCDGSFATVQRFGRTVEHAPYCQNYNNGNDSCFGEAWSGRGYMHCHYHATFGAGRNVCQARGMDLVDLTSAAESSAVLGAFDAQDGESWDDLWVGGEEAGTARWFRWVRIGQDFWQNGPVGGRFTDWRAGEPSNDGSGGADDCVSARQSDFRWNDRDCGGSIEFICEW